MSNTLTCYKCRTSLEVEKISFRTLCEKCFTDQHVCLNCRHYSPGRKNDCTIPESDPVRDREKHNFCDTFSIQDRQGSKEPSNQALERAKKLFGLD